MIECRCCKSIELDHINHLLYAINYHSLAVNSGSKTNVGNDELPIEIHKINTENLMEP